MIFFQYNFVITVVEQPRSPFGSCCSCQVVMFVVLGANCYEGPKTVTASEPPNVDPPLILLFEKTVLFRLFSNSCLCYYIDCVFCCSEKPNSVQFESSVL